MAGLITKLVTKKFFGETIKNNFGKDDVRPHQMFNNNQQY